MPFWVALRVGGGSFRCQAINTTLPNDMVATSHAAVNTLACTQRRYVYAEPLYQTELWISPPVAGLKSSGNYATGNEKTPRYSVCVSAKTVSC